MNEPTQTTQTTPPLKALWVTASEADWIMDKFSITGVTRPLALKTCGLVLEFAAEDALRTADDLLIAPAGDAPTPERRTP